MGMAQGEDGRRDVRYRVGRWLGSTTPRGIFGVLLLASVGFPIATWLEWLQGSLGEPLGVEIFMFLAWLLSAALAYAWWFFARLGATEPDRRDPPRLRLRSADTPWYTPPATPTTASPIARKSSESANAPPGSGSSAGGARLGAALLACPERPRPLVGRVQRIALP